MSFLEDLLGAMDRTPTIGEREPAPKVTQGRGNDKNTSAKEKEMSTSSKDATSNPRKRKSLAQQNARNGVLQQDRSRKFTGLEPRERAQAATARLKAMLNKSRAKQHYMRSHHQASVTVCKGSTSQVSAVATTKPAAPKKKDAPDGDADLLSRAEILLVETVEDAKAACAVLARHQVLAVDCEAAGMYRSGQLTLVQVATPSTKTERQHVFLFDLVTGAGEKGAALFHEGGLGSILESKSIVKLFHDCRLDSDCLYHQYQVKCDGVFDTQIGHALVCLARRRRVPLPIGLARLLTLYSAGETNKFKAAARGEMGEDDGYWARRPLTDVMIGYACEDVLLLPRVYGEMKAILDRDSSFKRAVDLSHEYCDMFRRRAEEVRHDRGVRSLPRYHIEEFDLIAQARFNKAGVWTEGGRDASARGADTGKGDPK